MGESWQCIAPFDILNQSVLQHEVGFMGYRRFDDKEGNAWEVRDRSGSEWDLEPVGGNPGRTVSVPAPGYQTDPFELSVEELQRLLEEASRGQTRRKPPRSPFAD